MNETESDVKESLTTPDSERVGVDDRRLVRAFFDFMTPYWWCFPLGLTLAVIGINALDWEWWVVVLPTIIIEAIFSAND